MGKYLGHRNPEDGREQLLLEHLEEVGRLAGMFAEVFGEREMGYVAGLYHDIGKYSQEFQNYLINGGGKRVDHSTAGAHELWNSKNPALRFIAFCVAGHHGGLPDIGSPLDGESGSTLWSRIKRKNLPNYQAYRTEGSWPPDAKPSTLLTESSRCAFASQFYVRMLFSCLVDADYLDTERFMCHGKTRCGAFEDIHSLRQRLDEYTKDNFMNPEKDEYMSPVNVRRRKLMAECMEAGDGCASGILRLTVPTGGGKTISSLAFALHHAVQAGKSRIIYVIPYTSIIEQTARVFCEILGEQNVIEHHSNVEINDKEELQNRKRLAMENWDAPVIVTTNVQFFESLFSSRPSKCRKLHHIANSVIIFDEAQMIPLDFLRPCTRAIEELAAHYRCTAVLCTATQPALDRLFPGRELHEICSGIEDNYDFFARTTIRVLKQRISPDELAERIRENRQVLCIVNSKKKARMIFDKIREGDTSFHLSTNLCPMHRTKEMEHIRRTLKNGQPCRVVATSLVEAGVDMDFPCVYRELAGLDSMIQAAGRCNREGRRDRRESKVFVFSLDMAGQGKMPQQSDLQRRSEIARIICEQYAERLDSPQAIRSYFEQLYRLDPSKLDAKDILGIIERKKFPFSKISDIFRLIDEPTKSVFIPYDEKAAALALRLQNGEWSRTLLRQAGKYMVDVYCGTLSSPYERLLAAQKIALVQENVAVLRDMSLYDSCTGLDSNIEDGQGIFI